MAPDEFLCDWCGAVYHVPMPITKERWKAYRDFGLSRGLKLEDADDFAQDVAIRCHVAGKEPKLFLAYVDFMRKKLGRPQTTRSKAVIWDLDQIRPIAAPIPLDVELLVTEVIKRILSHPPTKQANIKRLIAHLGISRQELTALIKAMI